MSTFQYLICFLSNIINVKGLRWCAHQCIQFCILFYLQLTQHSSRQNKNQGCASHPFHTCTADLEFSRDVLLRLHVRTQMSATFAPDFLLTSSGQPHNFSVQKIRDCANEDLQQQSPRSIYTERVCVLVWTATTFCWPVCIFHTNSNICRIKSTQEHSSRSLVCRSEQAVSKKKKHLWKEFFLHCALRPRLSFFTVERTYLRNLPQQLLRGSKLNCLHSLQNNLCCSSLSTAHTSAQS